MSEVLRMPPSLPRSDGTQRVETVQCREGGREGSISPDPHARARAHVDLNKNASLPPSLPTYRDINGIRTAKPREGGRHSPDNNISIQVERLAAAVRRLSVHHRDPERFHTDKHTIAAELEAMAAGMRRAGQ